HRGHRRPRREPPARARQPLAPAALAVARRQAQEAGPRGGRGLARRPRRGPGVRRAAAARRRQLGGPAVLALTLALAAAAGIGVRAPERLTAGPANRLLGVLGPDDRTLYFVSDEQSTTEVYVEDIRRGVPVLLFDEIADVSWPRPSPDGKHLLYISYRTDA